MCINTSAVILVFVALVVLPKSDCACNDAPAPIITSNVHRKHIFDDSYVTSSYGQDIIIHCSAADTVNLTIQESDKLLPIFDRNSSTIQTFIKKPNLGRYTYHCVNNDGCENTLILDVVPVMSVTSPRLFYTVKFFKNFVDYFVPFGDIFEIYCSGPDFESVNIKYEFSSEPLKTEIVNQTALLYKVQANDVGYQLYYCGNKEPVNSGKRIVNEIIGVTVDYFPESLNFKCFYLRRGLIECSWKYLNDKNSFKLFFIGLSNRIQFYEDWVLLCSDYSGSVTTCTVKDDIISTGLFTTDVNITLLLMTCNQFLCNNQTFSMDTNAIGKQKKILQLKVIKVGQQEATLQWKDYCTRCIYKILYRLRASQEDWRKADTTSVRCVVSSLMCKFKLTTLYPDAEYVVKVSSRYKESTDDRTWSDFRSIHVSTEHRKECSCSTGLLTQEKVTKTAAEASCHVCTRAEETLNENMALKTKVQMLKKKLAKINKYSELLSKSRDITQQLDNFARDIV